VAYRSIPRARRCRTHAAVAEWLERLAGDRRDEFIDLLAHHYEAASTPADVALAWPDGSSEPDLLRTKAVAALIDAGQAARKRASTEQALRFAERGRALAANDRERLAALEVEARSHHAAVRSDQALAAYIGAIELARNLGDTERVARLRAYATLLCARYAGAFSGDDWHPVAIKLVEDSQAEHSGDAPTFERAALLLGRSVGLRRIGRSRRDYSAAKRDAAEAVAIAETIESSELLAEALDILYWLVLEEGFCEAEAMAERLVRASADSADPVEAHESKRTAAQWFAWAGRFDRAAEVAREAMIEATRLSPHRALHSAMAQTYCLAPTGRFAELGDATENVLHLAEEDTTRGACSAAVVAIAGRVLWLYESLDSEAARSALDFMNRVRSPALPKISEYFVADLLRPLAGIEATRAMLDSLPPPEDDAATRIVGLRAQLPLLALGREQGALTAAIGDAHQLARSACAPALDWIADWAAAASGARDDPAASLQRALAATTALERYGEAYTAARLMTEFLPLVERTGVAELAEKTAQQLTHMGALASAARARSAVERT
jgi:hypothetical protein